jgi:Condensation domain
MGGTEPEVVPASTGQRTLWLADRYRGGNGLMSVPVLLQLTGQLEIAALEAALAATVAHYESLRTTVEMRRRSLVQVIHPAAEAPVPLTRPAPGVVPVAVAMDQVRDLLREEPDIRVRPACAAVWQTGQQEHVFALNVHHLATDGWSNRLVLSALGRAYSALVAGRPVRLPPQDTRYGDYATATARNDAADPAGRQLWADTLRRASFARLPGPERERPATVFRTRQPRPTARHQEVRLDPATLARLRATGRERRTTVFVLLLSAFMHALGALTEQQDLAVGSIFANRAKPELHRTVGMFATLSVLRARLAGDPLTVAEQLRRAVLAALSHQELQHGTLPLGSSAEVAHGAPGDAVFHMVTQPPGLDGDGQPFGGLHVTELGWPDGLASRFELELVLSPRTDGISGLFRYAEDRLGDRWVSQFRGGFTEAIEVLAR